MRRYLSLLTVLLAFPLAFTATAFAAGEASPDGGSLLDLAKPVFQAVMSGQYVAGAMLALVLAVALFHKFNAREDGTLRIPFFGTDAGGTLLTFLGSFGGAAATALLAAGPGAVLSLALAKTALLVAVAASGGYTAFKRLLLPAIKWLQRKLPKRLQMILTPVLWWFESSATKKAEAVGAAAVAAKPAEGAAAVTGEPTEL